MLRPVHGWRFNVYWNGAGSDGGDGTGDGSPGGSSGVGGSGGTSGTDSGPGTGTDGSPGSTTAGPTGQAATVGAPGGYGMASAANAPAAPAGTSATVGPGPGAAAEGPASVGGDQGSPSGSFGNGVTATLGFANPGSVNATAAGLGLGAGGGLGGIGGVAPSPGLTGAGAGFATTGNYGQAFGQGGVNSGFGFGPGGTGALANAGNISVSDLTALAHAIAAQAPSGPSLADMANALSLVGKVNAPGMNMGFPSLEGVNPGLTAAPGPSLGGLVSLANLGRGGIGSDAVTGGGAEDTAFGPEGPGFGPTGQDTNMATTDPSMMGVPPGFFGTNMGFPAVEGVSPGLSPAPGPSPTQFGPPAPPSFNDTTNLSPTQTPYAVMANPNVAPNQKAAVVARTLASQSPAQQSQTISQAITTAQQTMTPPAQEAFMTSLLSFFEQTPTPSPGYTPTTGTGRGQPTYAP